MKPSSNKYLQYLNPLELLQTKKVLQNNPTVPIVTAFKGESVLTLFTYNDTACNTKTTIKSNQIGHAFLEKDKKYWLNVDVINKQTVEEIGGAIGSDPLIIEDILNDYQRPKTDEIDDHFTCVLQMLFFNELSNTIEGEQVSFVLGENYLFSFQDEATRDLFTPIRERMLHENTKIRTRKVDYLLYALLDRIVDHYFIVLEKLSVQIEKLEEEITNNLADDFTMNRINNLRKELIYFKRNTFPVRDLIQSIIRSENIHFEESTKKYFKDIYDHILQVNDLSENYRDMITNIRDLYFNKVNVKLNEIMKFLAIVTTLLSPATVIGGIFGMNFERIPYIHNQHGFWLATLAMIIFPILLLLYFKKKKWF